MSGKFIKGFLIFAVVFFFVVVGLTVVMKRHENAQIAKEDKTLVAPDPQKIQRLVDKADLSDLPESDRGNAKTAVEALLKACPRIVNLITDKDEPLSVDVSYPYEQWRETESHFYILLHLKEESQKKIPLRFRSDEGYGGFAVGGGRRPGIYVIWPFNLWLCNIPDKMTHDEMNDALDKKEVTYKDLMQFIPLKDIPPNSF